MKCATVGEWRAYLDRELSATEMGQLAGHLSSCSACQSEVERLRANAAMAARALDAVTPSEAELSQAVWSRIRGRVDGRVAGPVTREWGESDMFRNLLGFLAGSRLRIATSAISLFVAMVLLFALTPVGSAAGDFLSVFRVKKFVAVTVDPNSLPNLKSPADLGGLKVTGDKTMRKVGLAEAQKAVGFQVPTVGAFPSGIENTARSISVTNAFSVTFTPDLQKVRAYLATLGATNLALPEKLDGAPITIAMPPAVAELFTEPGGGASSAPNPGQKFMYVGATTSPTLTVPDGIDVDQLRTELLKVPGLPADLVTQLKAIDDWRNTVVIPVVKGTSRNVTVQGQPGLLVHEDGGPGTTVIWQNNGVIYTVTSNATEAEVLAAANSLK
ncbi:MAG TPA: zf-HC2 domain-containing protein [Chloroflexota bacterium]